MQLDLWAWVQGPNPSTLLLGAKGMADIPLNIAPIEGENGIQVTETGLQVLWKDGRKSRFAR